MGVLHSTWGPHVWPWWLIAVAGSFLGLEIFALITNHANTLSDYAWRELGVQGVRSVHTAAWALTLGAWLTMAWFLTEHIWFMKFR